MRATATGSALSDVDEQSVVGGGGGTLTDRAHHHHEEAVKGDTEGQPDTRRPNPQTHQGQREHWDTGDPSDGEACSRVVASCGDGLAPPARDVPSGGQAQDYTDPVLKSLKEPRYQGFSSRVSESESRSQFHYVNNGRAAEEEEVREMKYRVLKALDQDVYYDFQHRKYRTSPATPVPRCNNEEDRPRVHFYKVKVNGDS